MKLGLIDIDTSHPQNWIPILRDLGHEIVAIHDHGNVWPRGHVDEFAAEHRVAKVCDRSDEMLELVDGVIVHSCDWDAHLARATPFLEAGKAVLIDKPVASRLEDIEAFEAWARRGARITGGSSLRVCHEVVDWHKSDKGAIDHLFCGCGVDEFNYGIHAYSLAIGLMGAGVQRVRHLGEKRQRSVEMVWADGRRANLVVGESETWLPFYATAVTSKLVEHIPIDAEALYRGFLQRVMPYLEGSAESPCAVETWLEPERCALAALKSREVGGVFIELKDLKAGDPVHDGRAFAEAYRQSKKS